MKQVASIFFVKLFRHIDLMRWGTALFCLVGLLSAVVLRSQTDTSHSVRLALLFLGPTSGTVEVQRGSLVSLAGSAGKQFRCPSTGPCRIVAEMAGSTSEYGSLSSLVMVRRDRDSFTFFLRDVDKQYPIFIPAYGAAVTTADDSRDYQKIAADIQGRQLQSKLGAIESEGEESFADAAANTRSLQCQTWLGVSRDMRIFAVSERLDWIQPRFHGFEVPLGEAQDKPVRYNVLVGRGWGDRDNITRRLEDGILPILHGTLVDESITYSITAFTTLENTALRTETLRGTEFMVADHYSQGQMFTPEQKTIFEALHEKEMNQPEETVLYFRAVAVNESRTPRYAFFKNVYPNGMKSSQWSFHGNTGFAQYPSSGRIFGVSRLNGKPLAQEESAILLKPHETAVFEVLLPHRPISSDRAERLMTQSFERRHEEAREFWRQKLHRAAKVELPEQRITEMMQAGLLHLDTVAYGREPNGTLTPTIGIYSAIGSESSPIIQYMDSMGWHNVARRALTYFLDKQHPDGFIQNFFSYMLETGAALWTMGEHYRYTRDDAWVRQIEPKLIKACEYIQNWRKRNQREDLRGKGYGMLEGKTADPEDPFRSFMLNGYHYLGMSRVAEMLAVVDPPESAKWRREADGLKQDIRAAVFETMGRSPVIPLGDGTWIPTLPPWVEYRGALALHAEGGNWFTHGSMVSRDSLLGPIYLTFQEVLDPKELASTFLLKFHNELETDRNVAFSQPYYSRHPWLHLQRGEVKPFLKSYYNTVASLADRQTYTFWEHYFGASPHKTHEEGWFLMQSRWMLYSEHGDSLDLLPGIPRVWLEPGKALQLENVATYFGPASLRVQSELGSNRMTGEVTCNTDRKPKVVFIRLPHPLGRKATRVEGGTYDAATERIRIDDFSGTARVVAYFD